VGAITTDVEVCNLALARLGQKPISSLSDADDASAVCDLHYDTTRRALLRSYVFNFAKKVDELTVSSTETPAFGYESAFALPSDFIRLLSLGDYTINADTPAGLYDIVGNFIYTDQEDSADTLNICYIRDNETVAQWDALFVKLMYLELAKAMAYAFTLKPSLVVQLDNELGDVRLAAAAVAGQEKPPRRIQRSRLIESRRMGGIFRDATRHSI
jgi:hypothetical protein